MPPSASLQYWVKAGDKAVLVFSVQGNDPYSSPAFDASEVRIHGASMRLLTPSFIEHPTSADLHPLPRLVTPELGESNTGYITFNISGEPGPYALASPFVGVLPDPRSYATMFPPPAVPIGTWVRGDYLDARLLSYETWSYNETVPPRHGNPAFNRSVTVQNATVELIAHNGTARLSLGLWPVIPPQDEIYLWNWTKRENANAMRGGEPNEGLLLVQPGRVELRFYITYNVDGTEYGENHRFSWDLT